MPLAHNSAYIDLLMQRLGSRTSTTLRATVVNELNVQKDILEAGSFLPWFLRKTATVAVVAGTATYNLPTGFIREIDGERLSIVDASNTKRLMTKRQMEQLQQLEVENNSSGVPLRFALIGSTFSIWPVPLASYTITIPHFQRTASITDTTGSINTWFSNAAELLLGMAGAVVSEFHTRDKAATQSFLSLAARARGELMAADTARQVANFPFNSDDSMTEIVEE